MDQFEHCGAIELLIVLDSATNNLAGGISSFTSLATQIGLGWEDQETSFYYAWDDISSAWATEDAELLGKGLGLLVSQIVKFESKSSVEVSPTG